MQNRYNKPIKLADSLRGINKNMVNKFGNIYYTIYSKWEEIVGAFFIQYSHPEKITIAPQNSNNEIKEFQEKTLHVNIAPAAAVEFQHFQNKILEKINSFFGYKAIHRIKIHQNFALKNSQSFKEKIDIKDDSLFNQKNNEIKDTIQKINDKELGESLLNLGLSVVKNEEN